MAINDILASGLVDTADEFYLAELWVADSDPPWTAAADLPLFEGGIVSGVSGSVVTLGTARRAINPATRADDYQTTLSGSNQTGRSLLCLSGSGSGLRYDVLGTGSTNANLRVSPTPSALGSGSIVMLCDRLWPDAAECSRSIDTLAATFSMAVADSGAGEWFDKIRDESWVYWRKRVASATEDSGWLDIGWFAVDAPEPELDASGPPRVSVSGLDALKRLERPPLTAAFQPDRIPAHQRVTGTGSNRCVVLTRVDESTGDAGFMRLFDCTAADGTTGGSPTDPEADHWRNWARVPAPLLYKSADNNTTLSSADLLIPASEAVDVEFGPGELRIQAKTWREQFTEIDGGPYSYVKARYSREATPRDVVRGTITSISGTTVTDTGLTGALALPTHGGALEDCTFRLTSGAGRGRTTTVASNAANAVTCAANVETLGGVVGDTFELYDANDPRWILEDCLQAAGFQTVDATRPLYIEPLDEILMPDTAAFVGKYDASGPTTTDITTDAQDESGTTTLPSDTNDAVIVGHGNRWTVEDWVLDPTSSISGGTLVHEYYADGTWTALPADGFEDGTSGFTQSGRIKFNTPNDWTSGYQTGVFALRHRWSVAPTGTLKIKRVTIADRMMAPPQLIQEEENRTPEDVVGELRSGNLIPPNWILYATPEGTLRGAAITQADTAAYTLSAKTGVKETEESEEVFTGVLYRGWGNSFRNLVTQDGVTIAETAEAVALRASTPPAGGLLRTAPTADSAAGIGLLIDGQDIRKVEPAAPTASGGGTQTIHVPHGGTIQITQTPATGGGIKHRWGYIGWDDGDYDNARMRDLDGTPLWAIDLGAVNSAIGEVVLVVDGSLLADFAFLYEPQFGPPIFGLEVSSDGSAWLPLCDDAQQVPIDRSGVREVVFRRGSQGWQNSWRYLRYKIVAGGLIRADHGGNARIDCGMLVGVAIYENAEIAVSKYLGVDAPFTGTEYVNRKRRYGKRLKVVDKIDYSADTETRVGEKAIAYLKELSFLLRGFTVDAVRPDAQLFDTVALTQGEFDVSAQAFLVESVHVGLGAEVSLGIRDYTLDG